MADPPIQIKTNRPRSPNESVFLIGPGGVGKSTLGVALASHLGWQLIDLDHVFCTQIANIGDYKRAEEYQQYRAENLALATRLIASITTSIIFVTSSGFLAAEPKSQDFSKAHQLIQTGYAITLLPTLDKAAATNIVVARQIARGFGAQRHTEVPKFQKRFDIYKDLGDMQVISTAHPDEIAPAIANAMAIHSQNHKNP